MSLFAELQRLLTEHLVSGRLAVTGGVATAIDLAAVL